MRAGRAHPVGRGGQDARILQAVALQRALDHLARQHPGPINRAIRRFGNGIAEVAEAGNCQLHSAASDSSVPMKPPDWRFQ